MDQFCILKNHGVKFGAYRITFDSSPHLNSPLEIHVNSCKWLKKIGIVMQFSKNVYFVNLNHITKFCYGLAHNKIW